VKKQAGEMSLVPAEGHRIYAHTMLAIFHLAQRLGEGGDPRGLAGVAEIFDRAGIGALPKPKLAVFVGSADGPDVSLKIDKGPRVVKVFSSGSG
jgi:hypothetical protein